MLFVYITPDLDFQIVSDTVKPALLLENNKRLILYSTIKLIRLYEKFLDYHTNN